MIKKLNMKNNNELLKFLLREKEWNLFMIGDLLNYGFDEEFLDYWGEYDRGNQLKSVLMRYYDSFIIYAQRKFDSKAFAEIMNKYEYKILSGEKNTVNQMEKNIVANQKRQTYYAVLKNKEKLPSVDINIIEETKISDLQSLISLQEHKIDEFDNPPSIDRIERRYSSHTGRGFHIKNEEGDIISSVETSAENNYAAMIIGVCTHPDYRHKGYATQLLIKTCEELLDEGKSLCLFYDNPSAGKIYKRIGFEEIGIWSIWKNTSK